MNFLPKLSMGIQRTGGVSKAYHTHDSTAVQFPNLNLVQLVDDFGTALPLLFGGGLANLDLGLPIYGNYCGPGYGDKTGCSPAKDQVDASCCKHDVCYDQRGYFDCGCDCDLVRSMPDAIANTSSVAGVVAGTAAIEFFANSPCVATRVEVCLPAVGCASVPILYPGGPSKCLLF